MAYMSSRERIIAALSNKQPDRIPASPDISNMIPCRLTGKPFWEVYINNNPPLWKAYLDAIDYFGIDGWFIYGDLQYKTKTTVVREIINKTQDMWVVKDIYHTPDGDMTQIMNSLRADSPSTIEKIIKDFEKDFKKFKHIWSDELTYDDRLFKQQKKELGEKGIMSVIIGAPGLHYYIDHFHGNLEAATYAYYDYPELFEELREIHERQIVKMVEIAIDAGTDSIITGGSGSLTLQSPDIWREYSLPAIKKITKMCKEAGVISGVHSCGKEHYLIEMCTTETDLDYVNPLEISPMGDCDLAEIKQSFGERVALMGNLHTSETMLFGNADDVRRESLKAIRDAGIGGGFVLSRADGILNAVDVAFNNGPFISPAHMDEVFFPYFNKWVESLKSQGIMSIWHTDGNLMPIMDRIIKSGVTAIQCVDPLGGMDIVEVKKMVGNKLTLIGNIDCALLQLGPKEKIEEEVKRVVEGCKGDGGFVLSCCNSVFKAISVENYSVMTEARIKYGKEKVS